MEKSEQYGTMVNIMYSVESILMSAIRSLVAISQDDIDCTNPAGKGNPQLPRRSVVYSTVRDSHDFPEVAIPVYGKPCIEMDGKWHTLLPGRFAVITPGVKHVEGCASAREEYTLLWLIFSIRKMTAFACRHTHKSGWQTFMSTSLDSPRVGLLRELIQSGGQDFSPDRTKKIRANILAVLSELHAKEIYKSENQELENHSHKYADMLDSLHEFINTHYADQLNVEYLSRMSGVSASYLNRLFKRKFGMGVLEAITAARMTAAKGMLLTGSFMIKQIAAKCGYDDPLYFSKAFRKYYGYSPSAI